MKEDNFDKKMREKLESLEPRFKEENWENLVSKMKAPADVPTGGSSLKPILKTLFYAATFAGVALALYQNFEQKKENSTLKAEVEVLKNNLKTKELATGLGIKKSDLTQNQSSETPNLNLIVEPVRQSAPIEKENAQTNKDIKSRSAKLPEQTAEKTSQVAASYDAGTPLKQPLSQKNSQPFKSKTDNVTRPELSAQNTGLTENNTEIDLKTSAPLAAGTNPETPKPTPTNKISGYTEVLWGSVESVTALEVLNLPKTQEVVSNRSRYAEKWVTLESSKIFKPIISNKTRLPLTLAVGTSGTTFQRNGIALGGVVELGLKNWRISTGVESGIERTRDFADESDFKRRSGREFKDILKNRPQPVPSDSLVFSEIRQTQRKVDIPLSLAYALPLKNGFSLLASSGTRLSFEREARFDFDFRKQNDPSFRPERTRHDGAHGFKKAYFSQVNFGLGLEKKWRHWRVQIQPQGQFRINTSGRDISMSDRERPLTVGFQMRSFYVF
jgi:hypothetical protein